MIMEYTRGTRLYTPTSRTPRTPRRWKDNESPVGLEHLRGQPREARLLPRPLIVREGAEASRPTRPTNTGDEQKEREGRVRINLTHRFVAGLISNSLNRGEVIDQVFQATRMSSLVKISGTTNVRNLRR